MLKVLFFGDIVGKAGRRAIAKVLPELKKKYQPDITIANGENLAHGVGITQKTLDECLGYGIDFFTSGNHIWKKPEVEKIFANPDAPLIRPANYPESKPGAGQKTILVGSYPLLMINLNGRVFIEEEFSDPFKKVDEILSAHAEQNLAGIIIDLHAEATSEKVAFAWYVNGRVSAVLGTHTHIPTADEKILSGGTAYITDVGMVGPKNEVLGVDKDIIINNFTENQRKAHQIPEKGECIINAVFLTIDPETKKAETIERINVTTSV
ncbi:MAG: TIGR00282 family metallophosphoesterase [Patescibacteria group bacterium]|jgi:hypothetical protein